MLTVLKVKIPLKLKPLAFSRYGQQYEVLILLRVLGIKVSNDRPDGTTLGKSYAHPDYSTHQAGNRQTIDRAHSNLIFFVISDELPNGMLL
jgi:hypothetical protein